MKKYRKYKKRKTFNPYLFFIFIIIAIIAMSVGYAVSTDRISIKGFANARYEKYTITYVLNGGTNPENAITEYTMIDKIPLPIPIKLGYKFEGWYDDEEYSGVQIKTTEGLTGNMTLYAKWGKSTSIDPEEQTVFSYSGSYEFTGENYINTNVYLYTEENVNKNFIISFNIESIGENNTKHSALMNSMDESGAPWPGHVVKISQKNGNNIILFESNSNTTGEGNKEIPYSVKNVRILRIDNYMYISFDGGYFTRINDYN